jgi:hypothetical protein
MTIECTQGLDVDDLTEASVKATSEDVARLFGMWGTGQMP